MRDAEAVRAALRRHRPALVATEHARRGAHPDPHRGLPPVARRRPLPRRGRCCRSCPSTAGRPSAPCSASCSPGASVCARAGASLPGRPPPPPEEPTPRARAAPAETLPSARRPERRRGFPSRAWRPSCRGAARSWIPRSLERRREILEIFQSLPLQNHFEVLGVEPGCTDAEVKRAYVVLAKRFHPDVHRDPRLEDLHDVLEAIFIRVGRGVGGAGRREEPRGRTSRVSAPCPPATPP